MANGGNGWIRLLEFDADGTTLHVKTYSPFLDQWDLSPDNFYDIQLSAMSVPEPATFTLFVVGGFWLGTRRHRP